MQHLPAALRESKEEIPALRLTAIPEPPEKRRRSPWRRILWFLVWSLFLVVVFVVAAVEVLLFAEVSSNFLRRRASSTIVQQTGLVCKIDQLKVNWASGYIRLEDVRLAPPDAPSGQEVTIQQIDLQFSPFVLLERPLKANWRAVIEVGEQFSWAKVDDEWDESPQVAAVRGIVAHLQALQGQQANVAPSAGQTGGTGSPGSPKVDALIEIRDIELAAKTAPQVAEILNVESLRFDPARKWFRIQGSLKNATQPNPAPIDLMADFLKEEPDWHLTAGAYRSPTLARLTEQTIFRWDELNIDGGLTEDEGWSGDSLLSLSGLRMRGTEPALEMLNGDWTIGIKGQWEPDREGSPGEAAITLKAPPVDLQLGLTRQQEGEKERVTASLDIKRLEGAWADLLSEDVPPNTPTSAKLLNGGLAARAEAMIDLPKLQNGESLQEALLSLAWQFDMAQTGLQLDRAGRASGEPSNSLPSFLVEVDVALSGSTLDFEADRPMRLSIDGVQLLEGSISGHREAWVDQWAFTAALFGELGLDDIRRLTPPEAWEPLDAWNLTADDLAWELELDYNQRGTEKLDYFFLGEPRNIVFTPPLPLITEPVRLEEATIEVDNFAIIVEPLKIKIGGIGLALDLAIANGTMDLRGDISSTGAAIKKAFYPIFQTYYLEGPVNAELAFRAPVRESRGFDGDSMRLPETLRALGDSLGMLDFDYTLAGHAGPGMRFAHVSMPQVLTDGEADFSLHDMFRLDFKNISGKVGRSRGLLGNGSLYFYDNNWPKLYLNVAADQIVFDDWITNWYSVSDYLRTINEPNYMEQIAQAKRRSKIASSLRTLNENAPIIGLETWPEVPEELNPNPATSFLTDRLAHPVFEMAIDINGRQADWLNVTAQNIQTCVRLIYPKGNKGGLLRIEDIKADLYGGFGDAAVELGFMPRPDDPAQDNPPRLRYAAEAYNLNMPDFLSDYRGMPVPISGEMDLALCARTVMPDVLGMEGAASVRMRDSNLLKIGFFDSLMSAVGLGVVGRQEFASAEGDITFNDEVYKSENFVIRHPLATFLMAGTLKPMGTVNARVNVRFTEKFFGKIPVLNLVGRLIDNVSNQILTLQLEGPSNAPAVRTRTVQRITGPIASLLGFGGDREVAPVPESSVEAAFDELVLPPWEGMAEHGFRETLN